MATTSVSSGVKADLAADLLADIELNRLVTEALLLKASRLARVVGAEQVQKILRLELGGYYTDVSEWADIAAWTGRWVDREKNRGWWGPLTEIETRLEMLRIELQQCRVPDVQLSLSSANPHEMVTGWGGNTSQSVAVPVNAVLLRMREIRNEVEQLSGIRGRVLKIVYDFVSSTYYELAFSSTAGSVFEKFQAEVDAKLSGANGSDIEHLAAIAERLATGDTEAISHAMTSCRRLIEAVADMLFQPRAAPVFIDGQPVEVGQQQYLNRLNCYAAERVDSGSRRARIRKALREIHQRVSAGVHDDITQDEARALSLQTYAVLGEIVLLPARNAPNLQVTEPLSVEATLPAEPHTRG
jgi:hypothetical protein